MSKTQTCEFVYAAILLPKRWAHTAWWTIESQSSQTAIEVKITAQLSTSVCLFVIILLDYFAREFGRLCLWANGTRPSDNVRSSFRIRITTTAAHNKRLCVLLDAGAWYVCVRNDAYKFCVVTLTFCSHIRHSALNEYGQPNRWNGCWRTYSPHDCAYEVKAHL